MRIEPANPDSQAEPVPFYEVDYGVVEDENRIRNRMVGALTGEAGSNRWQATSAEAAMNFISDIRDGKHNAPRLLILDNNMPRKIDDEVPVESALAIVEFFQQCREANSNLDHTAIILTHLVRRRR